MVGLLVGWLPGGVVCCLVGLLVGWSGDWLADYLVRRLADCLHA